jgi:hypothetical protein
MIRRDSRHRLLSTRCPEMQPALSELAGVHKTLWPDEAANQPILNIGILTGAIPVRRVNENSED